MGIFSIARRTVQSTLSRYGYQLERQYEFGAYRLDVLETLVERIQPERPDFFFVQVGANDGRANDPLYRMVEKYHWRGILLEPQPSTYEKLVANYVQSTQLIFENAALAPRDGEMKFWTIPEHSGLGSFEKDVLTRAGFKENEIVGTTVATLSASTLLHKHSVKTIDLLQVDTEGYDFEIIKLFISANVLPSIINYEHLHLSTVDRKACVELLGGLGYQLLQAGPDRIDTVAYLAKR